MAFNGSAHFKPGELVSYFESVGARLGPHVNAYTSFDETVYMLDLPTDKPRRRGARADGARRFRRRPDARSAAEIDKERGVVIEEWRGGLGAGSRIRDKQIPDPLLRLALRRAAADRQARDHPQRAGRRGCARSTTRGIAPSGMAVIAVGDIDPHDDRAADHDARSAARDRAPAAPVPDRHGAARTSSCSSAWSPIPKLTRSSVQMLRKRPREGEPDASPTTGATLVERLVEQMLDERFGELVAEARREIPRRRRRQRRARAGRGRRSRSRPASQDGKIEDGLAALAIEAQRVARVRLQRRRSSTAPSSGWPRSTSGPTPSATSPRAARSRRNASELVPRERADARHRVRVPAASSRCCRRSPLDEVVRAWRGRCSSDDGRVVLATSPQKAGLQAADRSGAARALARGRHGGRHALERHGDDARARSSTSRRRRRSRRAARSRSRRHHRPLRQRRRGLAEADRLQERPGALLAERARRRIARAARRLSQRRRCADAYVARPAPAG